MLTQIQNNKLSRISARDTFSSLQIQYPDAPLTLRDVENVYGEVQKAMNRGLPAIQAMISKLGDEFQFHYVLDDHERLERVLFFHNASLQLLRLFPRSYVLDSTYQTNRFNLPLLDIVGFTATNRSFVIGQVFLTHEEEQDYVWALQWIRDLYEEYNLPTPESITTDKAGGVHKACSVVWPEVPHLLCRWHINKDVKRYCQKHWLMRTEDQGSNDMRKTIIDENVKEFMNLWNQMLCAETEASYQQAWSTVQDRYRDSQPQILSYLIKEWLPYKTTFIRAWTDQIRHYGNVDSSRAEGAHQAIKRRMGSNRAHLNDVVDHLSRYLHLHNKDLRQELEYGQQKERTDLQNSLYRKLHTHISYYAIDQVEAHRKFHKLMLNSPQLPLAPCKGVFTTTKGLPCAHLLQRRLLEHSSLEIDDFDVQWRIDRLGELAELPPIRKITDPLTVRTRFTKSQKRQLSLFEAVQAQVDSLEPAQPKRSKKRSRAQSRAPQARMERVVSLQAGTASQLIDVDDEINSDDDPLGAELRRRRQPPPSSSTSTIQIRGWIHYQQPTMSTKSATPSPPPQSSLFSPLPELRTPSPLADLNLTPLPSPSPIPSITSLLKRASTPPPPPPPSSPPSSKLQTASPMSPMTSSAKKQPKREAVRQAENARQAEDEELNSRLKPYTSYKAEMERREARSAAEEDAIEQQEWENLRRTGGRAPPLWTQMPEFAGLTRPTQRITPTSHAPSSSISASATAAAAPPPRSPSPSIPSFIKALPSWSRPMRKRNLERYEEAKEALVSKKRRKN